MHCDICNVKLDGYYVDGRIYAPNATAWGYACITCWNLHGISKFGLGHARLYDPQHVPVKHSTANNPIFRNSIGLL